MGDTMAKDKPKPLAAAVADEPPVVVPMPVVEPTPVVIDPLAEDKERVVAIRKAAAESKADIATEMVKFLVYRGYSAADGIAAIEKFATDGHWAAPCGTYWGTPKKPVKG